MSSDLRAKRPDEKLEGPWWGVRSLQGTVGRGPAAVPAPGGQGLRGHVEVLLGGEEALGLERGSDHWVWPLLGAIRERRQWGPAGRPCQARALASPGTGREERTCGHRQALSARCVQRHL